MLLGAILLVVLLVVFEFDRYVQAAYDPTCTKGQVAAHTCTTTSTTSTH